MYIKKLNKLLLHEGVNDFEDCRRLYQDLISFRETFPESFPGSEKQKQEIIDAIDLITFTIETIWDDQELYDKLQTS